MLSWKIASAVVPHILRTDLRLLPAFGGTFYCSSSKMDLSDMRKPYRTPADSFTEKDLVKKEPIGQFTAWFDEICKSSVLEPNAMCLATCTKSGIPSARMVLLKGFGEDGFKFFTNGCSRKGSELLENPRAALLFYWDVFLRQVRIEGPIKRLPQNDVEEYFSSRPRESQIAAAVSEQSSVIIRDELLIKYETMVTECNSGDIPVPMPETWSGFVVIPEVVEFWQGQSNRLHDRIRFRKLEEGEEADDQLIHRGENGWVFERLAP